MRRSKRIGSVVPCEGIDPHLGSFLDYGVIIGWQDKHGNSCQRRDATYAIIEPAGGKFAPWDAWCEEHAYKQVTMSEFEGWMYS